MLIVGVFSSLLLSFILQFIGYFFTEYYEQSYVGRNHGIVFMLPLTSFTLPLLYTFTLYSLFSTSYSHRFHHYHNPTLTCSASLARPSACLSACLPLAHSRRQSLDPRHHNCPLPLPSNLYYTRTGRPLLITLSTMHLQGQTFTLQYRNSHNHLSIVPLFTP